MPAGFIQQFKFLAQPFTGIGDLQQRLLLIGRLQRLQRLGLADEVQPGFGRTGSLFAFQQAGIQPDLIALSKGLTGGFLPMGVTLAREAIFEAFAT